VAATVEEYVPAEQAMHAAEDGLPVVGSYVPTGHAVHADAEALPVDGLYVPAGQGVSKLDDVSLVNLA
jgi:hypothetical protein